jgi:hypothetical protein
MEETLGGAKTLIAYRQQNNAGDTMEDLSIIARDLGAKVLADRADRHRPAGQHRPDSTLAFMVALVGSILAIRARMGIGIVVAFMNYSEMLQVA